MTGGNRFVNQSQSNLWFTDWDSLSQCGRAAGWGGVWLDDEVQAGQVSDPFLLAGFDQRVLHLTHQSDHPVRFTLELDRKGDGQWSPARQVTVAAKAYRYVLWDRSLEGQWVRLRTDEDAQNVTAYFHYGPGGGRTQDSAMFAGLADMGDLAPRSVGIVRPRGGDLGTLQFLTRRTGGNDPPTPAPAYYEMGPDMKLRSVSAAADSVAFIQKTAGLSGADFQLDEASVVVTDKGQRYRLPKTDVGYDQAWSMGWPRGKREVVTERRLLNCHGTFYVLPHEASGAMATIKPVCTHGKRITDFCSWRGLLVLAGVRADAKPDRHTILSPDGQAALWCGDIDDLWRMGKPRGVGGPWKETAVDPGVPSDRYLMTGYDHKKVELSHDRNQDVTFTIEVDFLCRGTWQTYDQIVVPTGKRVTHTFPAGFSAHWVRLAVDQPCQTTAWFTYE